MMNALFPHHIETLIISAGDNAGIMNIGNINGITAAQFFRCKWILNANAPAGANTIQRRVSCYDIATGADNKGSESCFISFLADQLCCIALLTLGIFSLKF